MCLLNAISPITNMIVPGLIINELVTDKRLKLIVLFLLCLVIVRIINYLKERFLRISLNKKNRALRRMFQSELQQFISQMEYSALESPEVAVQLNRISMNAPNAPLDMFEYCCGLLSTIVSIIMIATIMTYISPFVVFILIIFIIINSFSTKKINQANYEYGKKINEKQNAYWSEFYNLTNYANGKEMRIFQTKDFFIDRFTSIGKEIDTISTCQDRTQKKWMLIQTITGILQLVLLYAIGIYQVINNVFSVGTMTIFLSAATQFSSVFGNISETFIKALDYCRYVDEIRVFMNNPVVGVDINNKSKLIPHITSKSIIEFKNVCFKYPGSDRYALHNVNMSIRTGETICLVGENGSGKSTFVKLITRLYKPTSGTILLDGIDINNYSVDQYQKLFSPVFQDYSKYSLPVKLSVALNNNYNMEKVNDAINKAGISNLIQKLSKGMDTYIGKNIEKDGFEPSGGESQKIAIARALYHESHIYILDEPTASLDPNSEYEIYSQFHNMIQGKTAIMITHRLAAVQLSSKVLVFDNGTIIESGTHTSLYSKGGKYKEMFDKQAQFYKN